MSTLKDIRYMLSEKYGIVFGEKLPDGHMDVPVFRARRNNEAIVVKIGFGSPLAIREVKRNISGYKAMKEIGAESIMPKKLRFLNICGSSVIIMEDLGLTFKEQSKIADNPLMMFQGLITGLKGVYQATLITGKPKSRGYKFLKEMKNRLLVQYRDYLLPRKLIDAKNLQLLQKIKIREFNSGKFCFGVWDFTPEDVFVKENKVCYIDPPPKVLGVPIIDIACFAGVSKDVYNLPGSKEGYELLHSFAIDNVARLLSLGSKQAEKIFLLGRTIQCSLSARFRVNTEPERAQYFVQKSIEFLKELLKY